MQNYSTIMGVVRLRLDQVPYSIVQARYNIGSSTVTLIMSRFNALGISYPDLCRIEPPIVEEMFFPHAAIRRKGCPMPDFQSYYDRIMEKNSKVNISYCWLEYKAEHPDGYEATQFYEYFRRFITENYGSSEASMPVERIPGEKMYIDWVGDQPEILVNPETGEIQKVHIFVTTIGVSSYVYAEAFADEKLPAFVQGTVNALNFYGAVPKYLVPDNLKAAVNRNTKDGLVLNTAYQDLETFYNTIVLPPPPRKPKGKPTVENHVRILETHLLEKLKEKTYTSLEAMNADIQRIIAAINDRKFQKKSGTRKSAFEKYDKPHMKPLPGGKYATCEYKYFLHVPNNYHLEYDGHYYSVLYTHLGKPAILKATMNEIRICDENNRLLCTHRRSYGDFPLYITVDSHMPPEHQYYKDLNAKDGAYYRRWAKVFGPYMYQLIDTILRAANHEEQAYNSCAGILHNCKDVSTDTAEAAARRCVEMRSCRYSAFKKALSAEANPEKKPTATSLPEHDNVRGKDHYFK